MAAGAARRVGTLPRRARAARRPGRAVGRRHARAPRRHALARPSGPLAHPRARPAADLPRPLPRLPVHGARGGRAAARLRPVRADLDARARLPARSTDAEAFRAWDEPGTVRVAFGHWVAAAGDGRAELVSEARVEPVDRTAGLRLRALWTVIGRFERLVGAEPLALAARRAGRRLRMPPGWSRTRCARDWMTRIGSRRCVACWPKREGRRWTALPP